MKLYYCTDCKRYYLPAPDGSSGEYLPAEEALAHVLAGPMHTSIRCDPCMDKAVDLLRGFHKENNRIIRCPP
jgi:hypothetical protein